VIDSNLPRFSQGLQAVLLALAFLLDARWVVVAVAVVLVAAALAGPRFNLFAYLFKALPVPRGEPEPAAPPRFAQRIGATLLTVSSLVLLTAEPESSMWWALGWGPALVVAVLSALAATTAFCLGCEIYLFFQRARAQQG
jgi:hypothetical protein